jgi:glycosyltransferase involved in cell wall biosynthesis
MDDPRPRLNILQVGSCFPDWGGTEFHLLRLSEELTRRGHRVTVACQPGRFLEQRAQEKGLATLAATTRKQQDWTDARVFRDAIRRERYDVVHVHWSGDYVVPPAVARQCGVPAVLMSRHHPDPLRSPSSVFLYGRVLFDRVVAVSESIRNTLVGQGMPAQKVVTVYNSVDPDALRRTTIEPAVLRAEWGVPAGAVLVGMVGRLAWEKGVPDFLAALAKLPPDANVYGVIVGDGPDAAELRARADALGLSGRLTFAGFRSDPNNALNALDVHVLASVWQEPCATVVLEAMSLGKPVVGTRAGGTPELIADGETGVVVRPRDPVALAAAQLSHARDPARRAAMGEAGRRQVAERFTLARMVDEIESLYYAVGARRRPALAKAV